MRVMLATLSTLLTLSACALQPMPSSGPSGGYSSLRAHIQPPTGGAPSFYVNRPAHVALFEIVPGRGASLVYPSPGRGRMNGFVFAGSHHLGWGQRYNADTYLHAGDGLPGPRYLFLIASEEPLRLHQFGAYGMGMRSALGMHFASFSPYSSMEQLASLALPRGVSADSWTTDLYVHWPNVLFDRPRAGRVQLVCNGYRVFVPVSRLAAAREALCGTRREPQQTGDSTARNDSTQIVEPQRRRPLPETRTEEIRTRITSSEQLRDPVIARRDREEQRDRARRVRPAVETGEPRTRERPRAGRADDRREEARRPPSRRPVREPARPSEPRRAEPERPRPAARPKPSPESRRPKPAPAERPRPRPSSGGGEGCDPCESR